VKNVSLYEIRPSFFWDVAWRRLVVDQNLPTFTAQCPRGAKSCATPWRKLEVSRYEILRMAIRLLLFFKKILVFVFRLFVKAAYRGTVAGTRAAV